VIFFTHNFIGGNMKFLEIGQEIETSIVAITDDCIFLDLNAKSEGILDKTELTDENGIVKQNGKELSVGDKIKVYYLGNIKGEMRFTTKIAGEKADKSMLENAFKNQIPVEGKVEKEIKGGFEIKIGNSRAFCPYSQMGFKEKEEPSFYVGKNLTFKIQEYKEDGKNILVSNKAVAQEVFQGKMKTLQDSIKVGMTVKVKVVSLQKYGAFVNFLGDESGFKALLPISEISRGRVDDVASVLSVGQELTVSVLKTDWKNDKVSVSLKSLLKNPWDNVSKKYPIDSKHDGKISRIADFGLFIELEEGIDGLVHISDLDTDRNTNLRKVYKIGDKMSVVINSVDADNERISLRPASSIEQDKTTAKYLDNQNDSDGETYNPFAALLKK
jgi:small subunit ribosomal protein S1